MQVHEFKLGKVSTHQTFEDVHTAQQAWLDVIYEAIEGEQI